MKKLPVRLVEREDAALLDGLPDELRLAMADMAMAAREGLLAMSVAVGLRVVGELQDAEMTATCGPKHAKQPDRSARRPGSTSGSLVLGSRRVPVDRPRARTLDGRTAVTGNATSFEQERRLRAGPPHGPTGFLPSTPSGPNDRLSVSNRAPCGFLPPVIRSELCKSGSCLTCQHRLIVDTELLPGQGVDTPTLDKVQREDLIGAPARGVLPGGASADHDHVVPLSHAGVF